MNFYDGITIVGWLNSDASMRLIATLAHSVWQGILIAVVATIINVLLKRSAASTRYAVWLTALVAIMASPIVTFNLLPSSAPKEAIFVAESPKDPSSPLEVPSISVELPLPSSVTDFDPRTAEINPASTITEANSVSTGLSIWQQVVPYVAGVYSAIVLVLLVRLILALYAGRDLRGSAHPITNNAIVRAIAETSHDLRMRAKPIVLACQRVVVPTVVGVLQPVVLLPVALVTALPIDQLKSIIAHEISHIKRWDHLVNIIQRVVEALLFFNPAVWWISNRLRVIREHCCDDMVVGMGVERIDYATMLLDVAELSQASEAHLQAALHLSGTKSSLGDRVRRLLGTSSDDVRLNHSGVAIMVALLFGLIVGMTQWSGNVTADDPAPRDDAPNATNDVSPNEADLDNGITIELVGLTTHPANPSNWWDGGGVPIEKAPYKVLRGAKVITDQGIAREVAIQIHGLPENYITDLAIDGSGSMATKSSRKTGVTSCAFTLPDGREATTIRVFATPEVWDIAVAVDLDGIAVSTDKNKRLKASNFVVKREASSLNIAFDHSQNIFPDGALSVVAIDKDGKDHSNSGMSAGGNREGFQRSSYDFKIAADKVAKFEIRIRLYRHVAIFENVSMHPDKKKKQTVRTKHVKDMDDKPAPPRVQPINTKDTVGWGEAKNGLQARLTPVREFWRHWEQPQLELEVRNLTDKDTTLRHLSIALDPDRKFQQLHGLRTRDGKFEVLIDDVPNQLAPQNRIADFRLAKTAKQLNAYVPIVPAGKQIRMPVVITAARNTNRDDPVIQPGRYPVTLSHMDASGRASFVATATPIEVLPGGINDPKDYAKKLVEYPIYESKILAGFVPSNSSVVFGAPVYINFVVRNQSSNTFSYGFGGDYRGTGRHDRFKIELRAESGQLLKDPKVGPNGVMNFGGIMWSNKIAPRGLQSTSIDLSAFRMIPKPGKYRVKCEFDLRSGLDETREFEQIVRSEFELEILPPDETSVVKALNQFFETAYATGGGQLQKTIDTICSFGGKHAVEGLFEMATKGDHAHRLEAIRGLGLLKLVPTRDALITLVSDSNREVQVQAIRALGNYSDVPTTNTVIAAVDNKDLNIQQAAAETLGIIGNEKAVQKLTEILPNHNGLMAVAILKGMGATKSSHLVDKIAGSLESTETKVRDAAVNALVSIGGSEAVKSLSKYTLSENYDFREYVIRHLAEKLAQPIEPEWLVPVLKSRKDSNSNGHAPRLMRLYCKERAAPLILSALDFENPQVRHRYNRTLVTDQLSCQGALAIPWVSDLNRDGKVEEIAKNKETLRILKMWVERDAKQPIEVPMPPWQRPNQQLAWGDSVDGLAISARTNRVVWPEGLPQVITVEGQLKNGSSASFQELPKVIEVEVNGEWYDYDREIGLKVVGDWNAYHGRPFNDLQLDQRWLRKSDKKPLVLKPGKHKIRVRVSTLKEEERHGLATSRVLEIEVLKTSL